MSKIFRVTCTSFKGKHPQGLVTHEVYVKDKFQKDAILQGQEELKFWDPEHHDKYQKPKATALPDGQEELAAYLQSKEDAGQMDVEELNEPGTNQENTKPQNTNLFDEMTATVAEFPTLAPYALRVAIAISDGQFLASHSLINRDDNAICCGFITSFHPKKFNEIENAIVFGIGKGVDDITNHMAEVFGSNLEKATRILQGFAKDAENEFIDRYIETIDLSNAMIKEDSAPVNANKPQDSGINEIVNAVIKHNDYRNCADPNNPSDFIKQVKANFIEIEEERGELPCAGIIEHIQAMSTIGVLYNFGPCEEIAGHYYKEPSQPCEISAKAKAAIEGAAEESKLAADKEWPAGESLLFDASCPWQSLANNILCKTGEENKPTPAQYKEISEKLQGVFDERKQPLKNGDFLSELASALIIHAMEAETVLPTLLNLRELRKLCDETIANTSTKQDEENSGPGEKVKEIFNRIDAEFDKQSASNEGEKPEVKTSGTWALCALLDIHPNKSNEISEHIHAILPKYDGVSFHDVCDTLIEAAQTGSLQSYSQIETPEKLDHIYFAYVDLTRFEENNALELSPPTHVIFNVTAAVGFEIVIEQIKANAWKGTYQIINGPGDGSDSDTCEMPQKEEAIIFCLNRVKGVLSALPKCAELVDYALKTPVAWYDGNAKPYEPKEGPQQEAVSSNESEPKPEEAQQNIEHSNAGAITVANNVSDTSDVNGQDLSQEQIDAAVNAVADNPNMAVWLKVCKTDPAYTKKDQNGRTSVPIQYRNMQATAAFGPIGIGWGYTVLREWRQEGRPILINGEFTSYREITHKIEVAFWYMHEGQRSEPITHYGDTKEFYFSSNGYFVHDGEVEKKSLSDALGKCLSMVGVCADVYLGEHDDAHIETLNTNVIDAERKVRHLEEEENIRKEVLTKVEALIVQMAETSTKSGVNTLRAKALCTIDALPNISDEQKRKKSQVIQKLSMAFNARIAEIEEEAKAKKAAKEAEKAESEKPDKDEQPQNTTNENAEA